MRDAENLSLTSRDKATPSRKHQYFVTFSATLAGVLFGAAVAYTSPAGPQLQNPTSHIDGSLRLSVDQSNWFSSSVNLAGGLGALLGGYCLDKVGRKMTLLILSAVSIVGWIMIAAGPNFAVLMVGRTLTGVGMGASAIAAPAYIGEIASPDIRGTLSGSFMVMITVGNMWAYAFGAAIKSWRVLAAVCGIPSVLCFVFMIFAKETPLFLLTKGKKQQAMETLQYFRGKNYDINAEFQAMEHFLEDLRRNQASFRDLLVPHNLKPFAICLTVFVFVQLSGITPVLFNLLTIFQEAGSGISEDLSSILVGGVQIVVTLVAASIVDRTGRKILLIISAAVMALALVGLGDYFYFKDQNSEWAKETLGWLPLVSLMTFVFAINFGFGPVQWILLGELLSPEVKGLAGSVATMLNWIMAFVVALVFIPMQDTFGMYGTYWFFGGMCVLALIFSAVIVPETKGKTMQEIAKYFGNPAASDIALTVNTNKIS